MSEERDEFECKGKELCTAYGNALITIHDLKARAERAEAQLKAQDGIFRWLLGESGDFPQRPEHKKELRLYWWRTDLRGRLAAAQKSPEESR